jgi:RNA polymerase sigma-70 factor, ECF subfamily
MRAFQARGEGGLVSRETAGSTFDVAAASAVTAGWPDRGMSLAHGAAGASAGGRLLDEESGEWLRCLAGGGGDGRGRMERERCLARLHGMLVRAARAELRRRGGTPQLQGHEREDLAHQAADDAMVAIIGKLGQFRGESRFTTWAYKFVVLEVSAQLGCRFRRHPAVRLGDEAWDRISDRLGIDPALNAESVELAGALRAAVAGSLSERQRRVFVALAVDEVPLDALAAELGSTRNAIYKTMFDARRKIRAHLVAHGYLHAE